MIGNWRWHSLRSIFALVSTILMSTHWMNQKWKQLVCARNYVVASYYSTLQIRTLAWTHQLSRLEMHQWKGKVFFSTSCIVSLTWFENDLIISSNEAFCWSQHEEREGICRIVSSCTIYTDYFDTRVSFAAGKNSAKRGVAILIQLALWISCIKASTVVGLNILMRTAKSLRLNSIPEFPIIRPQNCTFLVTSSYF